MKINEILEWQWEGYTRYHRSHFNLWVHIVTVPVFIASFMIFFFALITRDIQTVILSPLTMSIAFGLQGVGHSKEPTPASPFTSISNAIIRILLEQFITFPKFVFSGKWFDALKKSK